LTDHCCEGTELRNLHLSDGPHTPLHLQIQHLHSLTIGPRILLGTLSPAVSSSLRGLAFASMSYHTLFDNPPSPNTLDLLSILEALVLPAEDVTDNHLHHSHLGPFLDKVLFDIEPVGPFGLGLVHDVRLSHQIQHIRIPPSLISPLARLIDESVRASIPLRSVYLDSSLRPTLLGTGTEEVVGLARLLSVCQSQNIEVVYEEQPCYDLTYVLSPEFWRRQRALRRSEAAHTTSGLA